MNKDLHKKESASLSNTKTEGLCVSQADAGQKLLSLLARRYNASISDLHKIIRSGQLRVNSGRVKAFVRVNEGDLIRIPPFLEVKAIASQNKTFKIVAENSDFMIINKPVGLASHAGTDHLESNLASQLLDPKANFQPSLVHRLDKDTSGLVLVAKNYQTLREMQDCLALRSNKYKICKEYLVWVQGNYPIKDKFDRLEDQISLEDAKEFTHKFERQTIVKKQNQQLNQLDKHLDKSQKALCYVRAINQKNQNPNNQISLLQVVLITGRKHQIRVQLSSRNYFVIGDNKYAPKNSPKSTENLKLHAARLIINGEVYEILPDWQGIYTVETLPSLNNIL